MSLKAMNWVMEAAPTQDATALLVLYALADRANDDGTAAFPSQDWIAQRARCSVRTVRRKLKDLEAGGLIQKGDPRFVEHIRQDRRPTVWNLCLWNRTTGHSYDHPHPERPDTGDRADKMTGRTPEAPRPDTQGQTTGHHVHNDRTQLCPTNRPEPSLTIPEPPLGQTPPKRTTKRAHLLPDGWTPDQKVITQMKTECPTIDLEFEHRKFTDYWNSQPDSKARKKDWNATWRNWIRNARPQHQPRPHTPTSTTQDWLGTTQPPIIDADPIKELTW